MIKNDHQNYVTQIQYTKLQKVLQSIEGNPDGLPEKIFQAQVAGIKLQMMNLRMQMERYTRRLLEEGSFFYK